MLWEALKALEKGEQIAGYLNLFKKLFVVCDCSLSHEDAILEFSKVIIVGLPTADTLHEVVRRVMRPPPEYPAPSYNLLYTTLL